MRVRYILDVPEETAQVARAAFPNGNEYMTIRDEVGVIYSDGEFASLFSELGQPGVPPGLLAMATVLQYREGLTDRQAAEAVRARIDWKYLLGLPLTDPGFHYSVLSEFRDRLIAGGSEMSLLDSLLEKLVKKKLVKARGKQRTDSTHVLLAIRQLQRVEVVGETLRRVLNQVAEVAPEWLLAQITPEWFTRYGPRFDKYRLPKAKRKRKALAEEIGADGYHLLQAIYAEDAPPEVRASAVVEVMRQIWIQQYYLDDGQLKWREHKDLPPGHMYIQSPDDPEARNRTKRDINWTGYTVHVTETCDQDNPNLITHVETHPASTGDVSVTADIHIALAEKQLLPSEHFVDAGYTSADHLVISHTDYHLDLIGPVMPDSSWQAKAGQGFDIAHFVIDWQSQTATCPTGKRSQSWYSGQRQGQDFIQIRFATADCRACQHRSLCTKAQHRPRTLFLRPQAEHEALQAARHRQETDEFKERCKMRAGIEGTLSQGVRTFELRRSRYIGLAKTHVQHIATAAAINLARLADWFAGIPKAQTRQTTFAALAASVYI
jgi:transposase